jgi:hypothetical protein
MSSATIHRSPSTSTSTYSYSGCTAIARFAGKVHGVVVQITANTGFPLSTPNRLFTSAASLPTTGNFT